MRFFIFLLFTSISLSGISQTDNSNWTLFEDEDFTLQYPSTWTKTELGIEGIKVSLINIASISDGFNENINVLVQNMGENSVDLATYAAISEYQVKNMVAKSKIIRSETVKSNGMNHHEILYYGTQLKRKLVFEQHFWVIDDKAIILTLCSDKKTYKKNMRKGLAIFDTFKIID